MSLLPSLSLLMPTTTLLVNFIFEITSVFDDNVPVRIKAVSGNRKSLWKSVLQATLQKNNVLTEHTWRKTKLQFIMNLESVRKFTN